MQPLYIFDLDGTIANVDHRRARALEDQHHFVKFESECINDTPNRPVIDTMSRLMAAGAEIWIFSGRGDEHRGKTIAWLTEHTRFAELENPAALMMRRAGDSRPDEELKQEFLDRMLIEDRERLVAVFDDRDKVVAMWRRNGVTCFQVAPGDF